MTIQDAIDTLKVVLTKTNNEEVKTAVQNSINLLNNFGKDTLANPAGVNFVLPKGIEKLIAGMDSGASPRKVDDPAWAQELNKAILTDNLNLHRDAVKKAIGWDTGLNWASIISAAVAFLFFVCVLIVRPIGLIKGDEIDFDKISFFQNFGDIIIMLVAAAISAVSRLCAHKKGKKFCSAYGTSIAKAKNLIITEEEYKEKIQQARQLYLTKHYRGNIRKAKRIYNKLLKRDSTDPNCFVGLLAICSNNFTTYSGKCKEDDLIEDIEASKGDDNYSRLNAAYKDDYLKYKKEKVDVYKEKESKALQEKNRKRREYLERVIPILQQIGIYTVLVLPILLSIVVIVLTFCMPVKSFDNYSGWLYTTIFALDCLSVITLITMGAILHFNPWNQNFQDLDLSDVFISLLGSLIGCTILLYSYGTIDIGIEKIDEFFHQTWGKILLICVFCLSFCGVLIYRAHVHKENQGWLIFCCIALSALFFGFAVAGSVISYSNFTSPDYFEENSDGTYKYVICDERTVRLEIPSEYNGKPVTKVEAEIVPLKLKSIAFPESVNEIDRAILRGCGELEELTIPRVGFANTDGEYMYDPNEVFPYPSPAEAFVPIGYLFGEEEYEGSIAVSQPVRYTYLSGDEEGKSFYESRTFHIPTTLKKVVVLGGDICYGAFSNCHNLLDVTIIATNTTICPYAFDNCTDLERISILPADDFNFIGAVYYDSENIEEGIYNGCENIKEAIIPACAIDYIPKKNLQTVTLVASSSFDFIADDAFYGCVRLAEISLPDSIVSIGARAFYGCWSLKDIDIPNSVVSIGEEAFSWCLNLQGFVIPSSVRSIGKSAFDQCRFVRYNQGIAYVGGWAICYSGDINDICLLDGTIGIADSAFENCTSLTGVALPYSIIFIGKKAFRGCENLLNATFDNIEEWYVTEDWYVDGIYIPPSNLSDSAAAARYLTTTYVNRYWSRGSSI